MFLKKIALENFRYFSDFSRDFGKFNYIYGPNGVGKSSLIEAIYFLMSGRSVRSGKVFKRHGHKSLISFEKEQMKLTGFLEIFGELNEISIEADNKKKIFSINEKKLKKSSELFKISRILMFHPGDIAIIDENPAYRRSYFDHEFSMIDTGYFDDLLKIRKILSERNKLLKNIQLGLKVDELYLKSITDSYIILTFNVIYNRITMLSVIQKEWQNKGKISYRLNNQFDISELDKGSLKAKIFELHEQLEKREKRYGYSLFGPQRDEYVFFENRNAIKEFYSTGEKMKWILELKLAINKVIRNKSNIAPVMLMDDFFNFFDQKNYLELLCGLSQNQVFFTSQERRSEIGKHFDSVNEIELIR
ncbi:DNA replication/repair protein RecF [bacterium]|nr:DNA replication/repair protein RecF [bacterium]